MCSRMYNGMETKLLLRLSSSIPRMTSSPLLSQILFSKDSPVSGAQASSALAALSEFCMLESGE